MADYSDNLFYNANSEMFEHAHRLRKEETKAEKLLWVALRNKQILNAKFRRQHPIASFVADFYCHEVMLVVEVDGDVHDSEDAREHDANRTFELEQLGLTVIRFRNEEVFLEMQKVVSTIAQHITNYRNQITIAF